MKLLENCRKLLEDNNLDDIAMAPFFEAMEALKHLVNLCLTAKDYDEKDVDKVTDAFKNSKQKYLKCIYPII